MTTQTSPLNLEDRGIPLLLPSWAKQTAQQFAQEQPTVEKANQVSLNTLAVCAVSQYLKMLGMTVDVTGSDCWNPSSRFGSDAADLVIPGRGQLECRAVAPGATHCLVPQEVLDDRLGYVVVQIDPNDPEVTLMGFSTRAVGGTIAIEALQDLDELPQHLQNAVPLTYHLSQWFENVFEAGVQTLDQLFDSDGALEPALAFRSTPENSVEQRGIELEVGDGGPAVVLVVNLQTTQADEMAILVELCPSEGQAYLPPALRYRLRDETGESVMEANARDETRNLQFELTGEVGDRFTVELALTNVQVTREFII